MRADAEAKRTRRTLPRDALRAVEAFMRHHWSVVLLACAVLVPAASVGAQAPAGAPAGATGLCRDGSYTYSATKRGACSRHGGVQQWIADAAPAAKAPSTSAPSSAKQAAETPARGIKVWVNRSTGVYHCPGSRWYGTTKKGVFMTETEAKAAGAHPAYGKACS